MLLRVWAPSASSLSLLVGPEAREGGTGIPLKPLGDGEWAGDDLPHGTDYALRVDDDPTPLADPRSRWQPYGAHGCSRAYDHEAFEWSDGSWRGRPLAGSVVYELHVGTFTPEGSFDAAVDRLDHLVALGVDLVEVMPVASFPGRHGWGYDGVHLYAVHEPYGGPDAFKRFVDACHARGLGVVLDVVYNHLGPSGNLLPRLMPLFTDRHSTPWGAAVNLDDAGSEGVRRWLVDNALSWLRDFHVDGLRLDAVHALVDDSDRHLLAQLAREVDALATHLRRPLSLVAESDENDPATVLPVEGGGLGMTAQWSDDFHHALHSLVTREGQGYYADFAADPWAALERTLTGVFFHAGTWSSFRGAEWGAPVDRATTPGWRFLGYTQDHDQVGNRAVGDRWSATVPPGPLAAGAALVLTSPFTPMLWMGEEWAARTPWQYFTDHQEPDLATAVREGRRAEFAAHGWAASDVPDPQDPATVERSRLDWSEPSRAPHARMLRWYRDLVALRRQEADLGDPRLDLVAVRADPTAETVVVTRGAFRVVCSLAAGPRTVDLGAEPEAVVLAWDAATTVTASEVHLPGAGAAVVRVRGSGSR